MPTVYVEFISTSVSLVNGCWVLHYQLTDGVILSGVIEIFLGISVEAVSVKINGLKAIGRKGTLKGGWSMYNCSYTPVLE